LVNALIVAAVFVGIYEIEGHLIAPAIVSRQVKLTPLAVLLAVLIGAELGGIVGMLVAVPVMGVLRVIVLRMIARPAQAPAPLGANEKAP
jgi:predicted PurR-regulated permease PerM